MDVCVCDAVVDACVPAVVKLDAHVVLCSEMFDWLSFINFMNSFILGIRTKYELLPLLMVLDLKRFSSCLLNISEN